RDQHPLQRGAHHDLHHELHRHGGRERGDPRAAHRRAAAQPAVRDDQPHLLRGRSRLPAERDLRRSVTDLIRRGFDSMLANWPLVLIRIGEVVVLTAIAIAAIVATLVPIFVSAGLSKVDWSDTEHAPEALAEFLVSHVML